MNGGACVRALSRSRANARPAAVLTSSQEKKNVAIVVKKFNLSQKFVDMSYGIFQQLDLDQNGAIDQK